MHHLERILTDTLAAAHEQSYAGYSKFDALNSPILSLLSFNSKYLRFLFTQAIKEFPLNLRPLFFVKQSRNPKGIALFARSYLFLYQITRDDQFLFIAQELLAWLLDHSSKGPENLCWGYNYVWQSSLFLQKENEPNAVVSVFIGEAFIHAFRVTGDDKYLQAARSIGNFITDELPVLYEDIHERAIAYVLRDVKAIVLNNQVLTGAFLVKVWRHTREDKLLDIATKQMCYTIGKRTNEYAWYYTFPAGKSHIRHDNYHTGGILDAILEYCEESSDQTFMDVYFRGLEYYQNNLFEDNGAPRWMNDKEYPYDVHGSAQGIITFAKASVYKKEYLTQAVKIAKWTENNMYNPGRKEFIYRIGRFFRHNYSLMRWCNGWMTRALAELHYLQTINEET